MNNCIEGWIPITFFSGQATGIYKMVTFKGLWPSHTRGAEGAILQGPWCKFFFLLSRMMVLQRNYSKDRMKKLFTGVLNISDQKREKKSEELYYNFMRKANFLFRLCFPLFSQWFEIQQKSPKLQLVVKWDLFNNFWTLCNDFLCCCAFHAIVLFWQLHWFLCCVMAFLPTTRRPIFLIMSWFQDTCHHQGEDFLTKLFIIFVF